MRVMRTIGPVELVSRAKELLWVIARCDVENINAHRTTALTMLHDLESRASELEIRDLYVAVMAQGG